MLADVVSNRIPFMMNGEAAKKINVKIEMIFQLSRLKWTNLEMNFLGDIERIRLAGTDNHIYNNLVLESKSFQDESIPIYVMNEAY